MAPLHRRVVIRIHHEDDSTLWAEVPALPGCFAAGDTQEELEEALDEAIGMHLGIDVVRSDWASSEERELLISG